MGQTNTKVTITPQDTLIRPYFELRKNRLNWIDFKKNPKNYRQVYHADLSNDIKFLPNQRDLCIVYDDEIHFHDVRKNEILRFMSKSKREDWYSSSLIYEGAGKMVLRHSDWLTFWEIPQKKLIEKRKLDNRAGFNLSLTKSERYLICIGDKAFAIIETKNKGRNEIFDIKSGCACADLIDDRVIAIGDEEIIIYNIITRIQTKLKITTNNIIAASVSQNNLVWTLSADNSLGMIHLDTKETALIDMIPNKKDSCKRMVLNQEQSMLYVYSKEDIFAYDMKTFKRVFSWNRIDFRNPSSNGAIFGEIASLVLNVPCSSMAVSVDYKTCYWIFVLELPIIKGPTMKEMEFARLVKLNLQTMNGAIYEIEIEDCYSVDELVCRLREVWKGKMFGKEEISLMYGNKLLKIEKKLADYKFESENNQINILLNSDNK